MRAYLTVSGTTVATLFPGLPQWVNDLNVGIAVLLINVAALVVVTIAVRALAGGGAARPMPVPVGTPERVGADDGRRS